MLQTVCEDSQGQSCSSTIITMVVFWERSWTRKLIQRALLKPQKQQCCEQQIICPGASSLCASFTGSWPRFCDSPSGVRHCKQGRIMVVVINFTPTFQQLGFLVLEHHVSGSRSVLLKKTWGGENGLWRYYYRVCLKALIKFLSI